VLDDALLADWCLTHLGGSLERVLFRSGFLSEVIGVEMSSGLRAVVKARPFEARIVGCGQVQAALADAGFPCPKPLTGATRVADMTVTAEAEVSGGSPRPTEAGSAPYASLLARLIASAPAPREVASLKPSPPWAGWDHAGQRLWADLDEHGQDLNQVPVPEWVENAARRVRDRLTSTRGQVCVGHGDWEPQNIRWTGSDVLVVHDWDSVIAQPEAAIVGTAAAMWPRDDGSDRTASVAHTDEFISSYQRATRREWGASEVQDAWAASLWVGLIFAKQDTAEGGSEHVEHLARDLDERLRLAALD
jgi:hypothetical protein